MRHLYILLLSSLFTLLFPNIAQSQKLDHVLGDILVHLDSDMEVSRIVAGLSQYKGQSTDIRLKRTVAADQSIFLLQFDHNRIHEYHFLDHVQGFFGVQSAQFNHLVSYRATVPDDPQFNEQWQWLNDGTFGIADSDIDMDDAWDITTGGLTANGDTIVVAVIDDGMDFNHEDLAANIWYNHNEIPNNGIDDDNNGYVDDYRGWNAAGGDDDVVGGGHGVPVSGMIGAVGNNGVGVTGVNWDVQLMNLTIFGLTEDAVISAYSYPLWFRQKYNETNGAEGAFVVATNSSWGIDGGDPIDAPIWCAFYDTLAQAGIISCGATANVNWDIDIEGDLPTACPSPFMVSVTASNSDDERTFSAFGLVNVDVAAPGEDVYTTFTNNNYGTTSGTSFASPTVAGVIAYLYSAPCSNLASLAVADPQTAAEQIIDYIYTGVDVKPNLVGEIATGGRVNVFNSLQLLLESCGACPTPSGLQAEAVSDTEATLTWNTPDSAQMVDMRIRIEGEPMWTDIPGVMSPYTFTDLLACQTYEVELEAVCADTTSGFTNTLTFDTDGCCESPEDLSLSAITDMSAVANWGSILAAENYNFRYRPVGTIPWTTVNTTDLFFNMTDLTACTEYEAQVQTVCDTGATDYALPVLFQTFGCGACLDSVYCESSAGNADFEFIEAIELGNINNVSGSNGGYAFFPDQTTTLLAGINYDMTLTPGFVGFPFEEFFRVWIDLDGNGVFDDNELMAGPIAAAAPVTVPIVIPNSAENGFTRMRVAMNFAEDWSPCEAFGFGEVEDYCITIEGSTGCYAPPISILTIDENEAAVAIEEVPIATEYLFQVRPAGTPDWVDVNVVDPEETILTDLEPCFDYEMRIRTFCDTLTSTFGPIVPFRTLGCGACTDFAYCPNFSITTAFEYIDSLSFGTYVNASGDDSGYGDYTGDPIPVEIGVEYPVRISPFPNPNFFDLIYIIYIDLNQDGIFDPAEQVYKSAFVTTNIETLITIPDNALEGITRMRIQLSEDDLTDPCGEFFFGEVEDYCLEIMPAVIPCSTPMAMGDIITKTSIQLAWDPVEPAIGYNIRWREMGTSDWEENATVDTFFLANELMECTDYEFQVRSICGTELSAYSTTVVVETECPTSVSDPAVAELLVLPNPFNHQFSLQLDITSDKVAQIEVMTIGGQRVWFEKHNLNTGSNVVLINDLNDWPVGMYLLRLTTDSGVTTKRLVKSSF